MNYQFIDHAFTRRNIQIKLYDQFFKFIERLTGNVHLTFFLNSGNICNQFQGQEYG